MERGRILEPIIASHFAVNHEEYEVVETGIIESDEYPFLMGSPDGSSNVPTQKSYLKEAKTIIEKESKNH